MWSDRETLDDCLGFSSYVTSLAEVCVEKDIAPLTLGIFGSWGSGKTSLMKMLQQGIEERAAGRRIKTLWFNAWRYEGKDEIQAGLIHAVLAKLTEDKTLLADAKDVLQRLKKGTSVLKLAKFIGPSAGPSGARASCSKERADGRGAGTECARGGGAGRERC